MWQRQILVAAVFLTCSAAYPSVRLLADDYPLAGHTGVTITGVINHVDTDRDQITVTDDEDRTYTVDTYDADIGMNSSMRHGDTGDLADGMRVKATGRMLATNILAAERVLVTPFNSPPPAPKPPVVALPPGSLTCRGTVISTSADTRSFVLRIAGHTRTIYLSDTTDLSTLPHDPGTASPVSIGERVTVGGFLRNDGSVDADVLTTAKTIDVVAAAAPPAPVSAPTPRLLHASIPSHTLTGTVSETSTAFHREIKVRLNTQREVTVHVPKNIPIMRDGDVISVHDLWKDDAVRIQGTWYGPDFTASRIDVLPPDAAPNNP